MSKKNFKSHHINSIADDFAGNEGIGRYVFLPSSDNQAREIAGYFENVEVNEHPHGHNLYKGKIFFQDKNIEVASIATGIGCPSMEIIVHELFHLGAKRFLRIGTAGALQPWLKIGDIINAQASVRDENTTTHYVPTELPAIASLEFTSSIMLTAQKLGMEEALHTGILHSKSSLYARQFGQGPRAEENNAYLNLLTQSGVLASEMETAALFIQSQLYNHQLMTESQNLHNRVLAGAILTIISAGETRFDSSAKANKGIKNTVELALETVKILAYQELFH